MDGHVYAIILYFKRTILCLSVCPSLRMFGCARGWRVFVDVCAHDNDIMASCIGTLFYIFTYIHTYIHTDMKTSIHSICMAARVYTFS